MIKKDGQKISLLSAHAGLGTYYHKRYSLIFISLGFQCANELL